MPLLPVGGPLGAIRPGLVLLTACLCSPLLAAEALTLRDGDRVVLIGSTLIEREQREGYWETALLRRFPGKSIQVRNLGWSGDTVFADSRAGFDTPADGFRRLREHVQHLKPTVLLVAYGANESFAGPQGLQRFRQGLHALLDAVTPAQARLVLLGPPRQEDLGRPLPDPAAHNKDLRLYADALRETAKKPGALFVDLYELLNVGPSTPLTSNGLHLTPWGYWRSAPLFERGLSLEEPRWRIDIQANTDKVQAQGARVEKDERSPLRFKVTDELLPLPAPPREGVPHTPTEVGRRILRVKDLSAGRYTLWIDGKEIVMADADAWGKGVVLAGGPEIAQAERLRQAIVGKNRLYFHRWRPQNDTYLFGFRKQEQGQNAREIPQFDPLVAQKEADIVRLSTPETHTYELKAGGK
jgi:lysophospholipase L1-like esterase